MKTQNTNDPDMRVFHWDWCPHWAPKWDEIEGKAHHYKTAYRRSDGKILALLGISRYAEGLELVEPVFIVRDEFGTARMDTEQLFGFVL